MSAIEVAFLGTGLMGGPMARNLLKAGFNVTVWNRTLSKAEALVSDGAQLAKTAHDAVATADYIVTMVSDGPTVADMMFTQNLAGAMKPGATLLDMSSIKADEARSHASQMKERGLFHLDAPVSGGTRGATDGTLAIMVGGDEDVFIRAKPVFEGMGCPVRVGPDGAGQLSKLVNQLIVAVTIGVVGEAMLLAEKGGADPASIRQALKGGFADSVILQQHGERMTENNFVPGGPSKFQLKDIDNAMEEASHYDLKLPLSQQIQDRFIYLCNEMDGGDLDHSAIYLELLKRNGIETS
jgi:2-hydroxy-3-oxopropionate reductase